MELETVNVSSLPVAASSYNVATPEIVVKNDAMSGQRSVVCTDAKINMPGPNTTEVALSMRRKTNSAYNLYHKGKDYKNMDLNNPKTFNEKILSLYLNEKPELKTRVENKLWVRDYVTEKVGEKYLVKLFGVYNKLEELDFDKLPDQFVLKRTSGSFSKQVLIVPDKSKLDINKTKETVAEWLKNKGQVIAEEYLTNGDNDLFDYKVFCFNGEPKYIMFLSERKTGLKMSFYDTCWVKQNFVYSYPMQNKCIPKPDNLDEMVSLAKTLAKDFSHVRVDLYHLNDGTIKFGELTFKSHAGLAKWNPANMNLKLGEMLTLPEKQSLNN